MKIGDKVPVQVNTFDPSERKSQMRTVCGRVVYIHPLGRFATVRVPAWYRVTIYPRWSGGE